MEEIFKQIEEREQKRSKPGRAAETPAAEELCNPEFST